MPGRGPGRLPGRPPELTANAHVPASAAGLRKGTIRDVDVSGRRVLVRVDFNVPLEGDRIVDDTRIREAVPTIRDLVARGAKVILLTHVGRPDGQVDEAFRTTPLARRLSELLAKPVGHLDDCVGPAVEAEIARMGNGDVVMLENVRFHAGETQNDAGFARQLASLGDIFVNDAFGTAHRAHASTVGVTRYLPGVAGLLMQREIEVLGRILTDPPRPLVAIIGGAKISTKLSVLQALSERVDQLSIGGAMACTFFKAQGLGVGRSLVEDDQLENARSLLASSAGAKRSVTLPIDVVVAAEAKPGVRTRTVDVTAIPDDLRVLDVGPRTVDKFLALSRGAAAVVWNGPLGVYEVPPFDQGTAALARGLADGGAQTIIGGGDLVGALQELHLADRMSFISTGGGATLEFLEGKALPGIAALRDA